MSCEFLDKLRKAKRLKVQSDYSRVDTICMKIEVDKEGVLTYWPTKFGDDDGNNEIVIYRCVFDGVIFECSNFDSVWEIVDDGGLEVTYWDEACDLVYEKTKGMMPGVESISISDVIDPTDEERAVLARLEALPYFGYYQDEYEDWHVIRPGDVVPDNALTAAQAAAELVKRFDADCWYISVGG